MHRHFKIHKPFGFLSQFVNHQNKRRNKKLLGELADFPDKTMAIGRLDQNSEGLLLLTTDGKFSERIRSKSVEKEYWVMVDGIISDEAIQALKKGVEISVHKETHKCKPCTVDRLTDVSTIPDRYVRHERHGPVSWISVIITEGKYRQVRKMTAKVGFPTLRLVRVRVGGYRLEDLQSGEVEEIFIA